jgi:alkanesulfonate monooxygenase SsuD/methylene tetrahydromethanopterin reductase-like flavin-dependent oxidoreductase (luciferase family)
MKFGIGPMTSQVSPSSDLTVDQQYRNDLAVIEAADDLGFDSAWFGEHHFVDDGHCSSPLAMLSAAAARTSDITLGSAILLAPLYHPIKLAETAATIDNISEGRFVFGLGMGYRDEEMDGFGVPLDEKLPRFVETVRVIRQIWTDGTAEFDGKVYEYGDIEVHPEPYREGGPPIWIGATTERAIRRAGRLGDNWIAGQFFEISGIERRVSWFKEGANRDHIEIPLGRHCFVAESEEAAWAAVRDGIEHRERNYFEWDDKEWSPDHLARLREKGIFGSPEEVTAELQRYDEEIDDDIHFLLLFNYPGMDLETVIAGLKLFAEDVMPRLDG